MTTPVPCVIIPCGARKLDCPAPAAELYTGSYFRACLATARALTPRADRVFILSARYGLLATARVVEPYELRLPSGRRAADAARRALVARVGCDLAGHGLRHTEPGRSGFARWAAPAPDRDEPPVIVGLCTGDYAAVLRDAVPGVVLPLEALPPGARGIGHQLRALARLRREGLPAGATV